MPAQEKPLWYVINNVETIDTPALVIYPDRVQKNIQTAINMVGNVNRLRPHIKTHKSADVIRLMMDAGIRRFKCATIAEAELLAIVSAPDALLAYQPVGPKIKRLIELIRNFPATQFSCLVDQADAAQAINDEAEKNGMKLPVMLDLNVGMNRTGIAPGKEAFELAEKLTGMQALKLIGLHAYDGHINDSDMTLRAQRCHEAFAPLQQLKEDLLAKGYDDLVIVAGGSPTFPIHAQQQDVECSPGTFVYWDAGYQENFPEQAFLPAALVLTRIVSRPGERLLCADLGHKAIAAENPLQRRVQFVNASGLEVVGQSEEHLVLRNRDETSFHMGDVLYGMPIHICPTCALYGTAVVIKSHLAADEWKIAARERKITF